jgi:hypothetical protein
MPERKRRSYCRARVIEMNAAEPTELEFLARNVAGEEKKRVKALAKLLADTRRRAGDGTELGGTPFTILKLANNPIGRLVDSGRIGAEELRAASEIAVAYYSITGALQIKPVNLDRVDCGSSAQLGTESPALALAQRRFRQFSDFWSQRAKRGDPTLEIVIRAVVEERPFSAIERDVGIRHGAAAGAVVRALRHYAALARWVDPSTAQTWTSDAQNGFRLRRDR